MTDDGPRPISEILDDVVFVQWPTIAITNSHALIQHYRKLLDDVWTVLQDSSGIDVARDPAALQDLINKAVGMIEEGTASDDYEDLEDSPGETDAD